MTRVGRKRQADGMTTVDPHAGASQPAAAASRKAPATSRHGAGGHARSSAKPLDAAAGSALAETLALARLARVESEDSRQASVAAVREALLEGRIAFDADKLVALIERFHGGGR
ncbi:flagellar biosynthesis anti-sigma factor FlgM [Chitinasiproducens palmae]|uniref:Negative regulator of flagellin synthesis n=1 Tax=Chitinasiproducens palmae TaxID=1770053 RepID=A0A1H2PKM7_9BURK|nr:flagellar biosynthesis anti-sigma factor FlgM [Chitinasiproducens palmae]SDV46944.1 hypothetical protein SAMN05216551_102124 [Chitinasiproducens palmae]